MGETIAHEDNEKIPVLKMERFNVELELNKWTKEVDFIDIECAEIDELYPAMDNLDPSDTNVEPIGVEDTLRAQVHDLLCTEISHELN